MPSKEARRSHQGYYTNTIRNIRELLDGGFGKEMGDAVGERLDKSKDKESVAAAIEIARQRERWGFSAGIRRQLLKTGRGQLLRPDTTLSDEELTKRGFGLPILLEVIADDTFSQFSNGVSSRLGMAYKVLSERDRRLVLKKISDNAHMQNNYVEGEFTRRLATHSFGLIDGDAQAVVLEHLRKRLDQPPGAVRHFSGVKLAILDRVTLMNDEAVQWLAERAAGGKKSETLESVWRATVAEFPHLTRKRKNMIIGSVEKNPDSLYSGIAGIELKRNPSLLDYESEQRFLGIAKGNPESAFSRVFIRDESALQLSGLARGALSTALALSTRDPNMLDHT